MEYNINSIITSEIPYSVDQKFERDKSTISMKENSPNNLKSLVNEKMKTRIELLKDKVMKCILEMKNLVNVIKEKVDLKIEFEQQERSEKVKLLGKQKKKYFNIIKTKRKSDTTESVKENFIQESDLNVVDSFFRKSLNNQLNNFPDQEEDFHPREDVHYLKSYFQAADFKQESGKTR